MTEREIIFSPEEKKIYQEHIDQFLINLAGEDNTSEEVSEFMFTEDYGLPSIPTSSETKEIEIRPDYFYELNTREKVTWLFEHHKNNYPNEPINLSRLARELGITRQSVSRYYRMMSGETDVPETGKLAAEKKFNDLYHQFFNLREAGIKSSIIQDALGLSKSETRHLFKIAKSEDVVFPDFLEPFDLEKEEILSLKRQGYTNEVVAEKLGLQHEKVRIKAQHMLRTGEIPRERTRRRSEEELAELDKRVMELSSRGYGNKEIAQQLNERIFRIEYSKIRIKKQLEYISSGSSHSQ